MEKNVFNPVFCVWWPTLFSCTTVLEIPEHRLQVGERGFWCWRAYDWGVWAGNCKQMTLTMIIKLKRTEKPTKRDSSTGWRWVSVRWKVSSNLSFTSVTVFLAVMPYYSTWPTNTRKTKLYILKIWSKGLW